MPTIPPNEYRTIAGHLCVVPYNAPGHGLCFRCTQCGQTTLIDRSSVVSLCSKCIIKPRSGERKFYYLSTFAASAVKEALK